MPRPVEELQGLHGRVASVRFRGRSSCVEWRRLKSGWPTALPKRAQDAGCAARTTSSVTIGATTSRRAGWIVSMSATRPDASGGETAIQTQTSRGTFQVDTVLLNAP